MSSAYISHLFAMRKNIGTRTAPKIENELKLPAGYLDSLHSNCPISADNNEKAFIQSCPALYRQNPLIAQSMVLTSLGKLVGKNKRHTFK